MAATYEYGWPCLRACATSGSMPSTWAGSFGSSLEKGEEGAGRDGLRRHRGGRSPPTCHSRVVAEARGYYSVRLTLKDSDAVDDFYKYRGEELPEVGEVIEVVRFLRDLRPTRARVTRVDARLQPRITAIQID